MGIIGYKGNIVDTVVKIMDMGESGPRLLRGSKKRRNGAEQFEEEHNREFDAHKPSDRVERVLQHNSAYPKIKDELDRRQSITKVTSINAKSLKGNNDQYCSVCARLMAQRAHRKRTLKPRCGSRSRPLVIRSASKLRGSHHSRVTKSETKRPGSKKHTHSGAQRHRSPIVPISRACQCPSALIPANASESRGSHPAPATSEHLADHPREPSKYIDPPEFDKKTETSQLSSYHSFISMDQEPMVHY